MTNLQYKILQEKHLQKIAYYAHDVYLPMDMTNLIYSFILRSKYVISIMSAEQISSQRHSHGHICEDIYINIPASHVECVGDFLSQYLDDKLDCICDDYDDLIITLDYQCMDCNHVEHNPGCLSEDPDYMDLDDQDDDQDNSMDYYDSDDSDKLHTVPLLWFSCVACDAHLYFNCKIKGGAIIRITMFTTRELHLRIS